MQKYISQNSGTALITNAFKYCLSSITNKRVLKEKYLIQLQLLNHISTNVIIKISYVKSVHSTENRKKEIAPHGSVRKEFYI